LQLWQAGLPYKMKIIKEISCYEEKIQRSTFMAQICPISTWQEAKEFITKINQEHKNATHNCWAYIVGSNGETQHSSDAGEPPGTAGKPMLNALNKFEMTNIVAVVTRYFGGVKLGVRGLIDAYGGVLEQALEAATREELVFKKSIHITTCYDFYNTLKHRISLDGIEIINTEYTDKIDLSLKVREDIYPELMKMLDEMGQHISLSEPENE